MAIQDFTGGVNQLLENFGLGSSWNLSVCKYVAPNDPDNPTPEKDRTITFYDACFLAQLDLSVFPTAELLFQGIIDYKTKSSADSSGKTKLLDEALRLTNNIQRYQLPSGREIIRTWGTKATSFQMTTLLCGAGYLEKLKLLSQIVSTNSDLVGGTLYHPVLGELPNTHIVQLTTNESAKAFNGSIVTIEFITESVYDASLAKPPSLASTILGYIQKVVGLAQTISTLANVKEQLNVAFSPLLRLAGGGSTSPTVSGGKAVVLFTTPTFLSPLITAEGAGGVAATPSNEEEASLFELEANGIPTDFDLVYNTRLVFENLTRFGNLNINGYGSGYISEEATSAEYVISIANFVYSENSISADGTITQIYRKLDGVKDGLYVVDVTTITSTPPP